MQHHGFISQICIMYSIVWNVKFLDFSKLSLLQFLTTCVLFSGSSCWECSFGVDRHLRDFVRLLCKEAQVSDF